MKITAVLGSPTKNGNTCILSREVLRGAAEAANEKSGTEIEIEEIFLPEHHIEFCLGCISRNVPNQCMATGSCILNDDLNGLKEKLYSSDGIVLASPSYGLAPTARMKNFIVDRIGMFTAYTSGLAGKYFVGVSTAGGIGAKKVAKELAEHFIVGFHARGFLTGHIGVLVGNDGIEKQPDALRRAYRMGQKMYSDIRTGRRYPLQKLPRRLINRIPRKIILKNIYRNKDGSMKAVYENLVKRGLIPAA